MSVSRFPAATILTLFLAASAIAQSPRPKKTSTPKPAVAATPAPADASPAPASKQRAPNATVEAAELAEYSTLPPRVRQLIESGLALTRQNLTYTYGSADPAGGGMDCSGTIHYLLKSAGFTEVPRDSPGLYSWVRKAGEFRSVVSRRPDSFEFDELLPGDLLFWSGTYSVQRDIPVTHVMLYLGTEKRSKKRIMFGASDGRSYDGIQRWGVSVFDFKMPSGNPNPSGTTPTFLGYGRIPGLRSESESRLAADAGAPAEPAANANQQRPTSRKKPK